MCSLLWCGFNFCRSENEGLIPRCLSSVLKEVHIGQNKMFNVQVSFLGIYEETAYDLLGTLLYKGQNGKDLPKVTKRYLNTKLGMIQFSSMCQGIEQVVSVSFLFLLWQYY